MTNKDEVSKLAGQPLLMWVMSAVFALAMTFMGLVQAGQVRETERIERDVAQASMEIHRQDVDLSKLETEYAGTMKRVQSDIAEIKAMLREEREARQKPFWQRK